MRRYLVNGIAVLCLCLVGAPARAEVAQVIVVLPCNLMCGLWRNLSGNAQVSSSIPIDHGVVNEERIPDATEGIGAPKSSELAATPGTIIQQSPAERALLRKQRARLEREITANIDGRVIPFKSNQSSERNKSN